MRGVKGMNGVTGVRKKDNDTTILQYKRTQNRERITKEFIRIEEYEIQYNTS
jgi:hypothetical protein